jgi:hypothetical protein
MFNRNLELLMLYANKFDKNCIIYMCTHGLYDNLNDTTLTKSILKYRSVNYLRQPYHISHINLFFLLYFM